MTWSNHRGLHCSDKKCFDLMSLWRQQYMIVWHGLFWAETMVTRPECTECNTDTAISPVKHNHHPIWHNGIWLIIHSRLLSKNCPLHLFIFLRQLIGLSEQDVDRGQLSQNGERRQSAVRKVRLLSFPPILRFVGVCTRSGRIIWVYIVRTGKPQTVHNNITNFPNWVRW